MHQSKVKVDQNMFHQFLQYLSSFKLSFCRNTTFDSIGTRHRTLCESELLAGLRINHNWEESCYLIGYIECLSNLYDLYDEIYFNHKCGVWIRECMGYLRGKRIKEPHLKIDWKLKLESCIRSEDLPLQS